MVDKTQENTTFVVNETRKGNSFEVGKAGARWKLYFNDADDLTKQIADLIVKGFDVWGKEEKCAKDTVNAGTS